MTPREFVRKWRAAELKERSAAQEHFLDLCELLGHGKPAALDPKGDFFCFEILGRFQTAKRVAYPHG